MTFARHVTLSRAIGRGDDHRHVTDTLSGADDRPCKVAFDTTGCVVGRHLRAIHAYQRMHGLLQDVRVGAAEKGCAAHVRIMMLSVTASSEDD